LSRLKSYQKTKDMIILNLFILSNLKFCEMGYPSLIFKDKDRATQMSSFE
jgi:hypothetical protein